MTPDLVRSSLKAARRQLNRYPRIRSANIVSDPFRFICAAIPKVGSRSLVAALEHLQPELIRSRLSQLLLARPSYRRYFIFTFVRNPWDRVVSCYVDKIAQPSPRTLAWLRNYDGIEPGARFEKFIEFLASPRGMDHAANEHWASQHLFLSRSVDLIGRQETMDTDFNAVIQRIGLKGVVLPTESRRHDSGAYRDWYTPKSQRLVAERYETDIRLYGYRF